MTNRDALIEALHMLKLENKDVPITIELADKMLESDDSAVEVLSFISRLCEFCPEILVELNIIQINGILG